MPMPIPCRVDLTVKINEFPSEVAIVTNGWKEFKVVMNDGRFISISVRPAIFKRFEEMTAKYPLWVAAIGGQLGPLNGDTFSLLQPVINVFERKPKEAKPEETDPPK